MFVRWCARVTSLSSSLPVCRNLSVLDSSTNSCRQGQRCHTDGVHGVRSTSSTLLTEEEPGTGQHPRRAVMYVPTSDERKTQKAAELAVDTIVFDLEDGVAANQKEKARERLPLVLSSFFSSSSSATDHCHSSSSSSEIVVRINGVDSGMMADDLAAIFWSGATVRTESNSSADFQSDGSRGVQEPAMRPDALMVPKLESVEQLKQLDLALALYATPTSRPIPVMALVESPQSILGLEQLCCHGTQGRTRNCLLSALVFGSDDYQALLGGSRSTDSTGLLYARQRLATCAKAHGLDAIDMVHIDYKDLEGLRVESEEGWRMGFTGKQVIHPGQVPVVQRAFSPTQEQVEWAKGLTEAFKHHQDSGKGAFVYKGKMIDRPLLLQAQNILKTSKIPS